MASRYRSEPFERLIRESPRMVSVLLFAGFSSLLTVFLVLGRVPEVNPAAILFSFLMFSILVLSAGGSIFYENIKFRWLLMLNSALVGFFGIFFSVARYLNPDPIFILVPVALTTILSFASLIVLGGRKYRWRDSVYSSGVPLILGFYLGSTAKPFVHPGLMFGAVAGALTISYLDYTLNEHLFELNTRVSGARLSSELISRKQDSLSLGEVSEVDANVLEIDNGERFDAFIPRVHSGPLANFGAGRLSEEAIKELNSEGEGFIFHFPSSHRSDPIQSDASSKLLKCIENAVESGEKVSRIYSRQYDEYVLYGRRYRDFVLIYLESDYFDDYSRTVFTEIFDPDQCTVVDTHSGLSREGEEIYQATKEAGKLRDRALEFRDWLLQQELEPYRAGFNFSEEVKPHFCLVEEAGDQRTAVIGVDENGLSDSVLEYMERNPEGFDKVVTLSTDTHGDLSELARPSDLPEDVLAGCVSSAEDDVSASTFEVREGSTDLRLLYSDYYSLVDTINILARLYPVTVISLCLAGAAFLLV